MVDVSHPRTVNIALVQMSCTDSKAENVAKSLREGGHPTTLVRVDAPIRRGHTALRNDLRNES